MALEVERRFLVEGEQWRELAGQAVWLSQGYLTSHKDEWTVRVRINSRGQAWLTMKFQAEGFATYEFEYPIPTVDAESILELIPKKIVKTRYAINLNQGKWVVDCFEGENAPLIIAEVEIANTEAIIEQPTWCGKEITGEYLWSNAALAQNPISEWSIESRLKQNAP